MSKLVVRLGFGAKLFTALLVAACGGETAEESSPPNPAESEPNVPESSTDPDANEMSGATNEDMPVGEESLAPNEEEDPSGGGNGSQAIPGVVLIEDGEDGDARLLQDEASGWDGYWYTYDDKSECTNVTPELGLTNPPTTAGGFVMSEYAAGEFGPAPLEGVQSDNLFGIRIWGGGHTAPAAGGFGAGLGFAMNNANGLSAYDLLAQGFVGIRFQVRSGLGEQPLSVKIKDAWSEPAAGNCIPRDQTICDVESCHDDPLVSIVATPEWTIQTLMFSDFARAGWSMNYTTPPPDNLLHADVAYQVQFEIASTAMFDLWFDNIGFVLGDGNVAAPVSDR